jgi:glutamate-ammonia-ligase adenylyltransferase
LQAALRLLSDSTVDPAALGIGGRAFVLRETGFASEAELSARLAQAAGLAEAVINAHLPG